MKNTSKVRATSIAQRKDLLSDRLTVIQTRNGKFFFRHSMYVWHKKEDSKYTVGMIGSVAEFFCDAPQDIIEEALKQK